MRSSDYPADRPPPTVLGELARRREIVDGALTCGEIERAFASHSRWGSLVIHRVNGGLTILDRDRFMGQMAGQLGYGRALYDRQPVERLTGDAPVLALGERTALDAAAAAVLGRAETYRYDDLLVMLDDGGVATLVVADLFAALSEIHGHSALHDPLTGLANRQLLLDRLRHARARLIRRGGDIAVLFIDLDDFKNVNDSLGHAAGDEVLVAVAERLLAAARTEDTVARLGGDEFAILQQDGVADGAPAAAQRIVQALGAPIVAGGRSIDISASVGIATADASTPAEVVLRNADLAMYSAKRSGKRRSADYDPAMHSDALARLELKVDLERALERDELYLVYQPIVALADDRVIGVESLLRWRHPERGIVAPGEFIALAEETGAIVPIGRWVLGEACRQAATWREASPAASDVNVGVNLSPRQLELPDFVADVERALAAAGLPGDRLVVELTEGMGVRDLAGAHATLTALRKLGVRISIDDFGTGFTSLSYLRQLPIDSLKIDRAFITDIATDPHARRLLDGLLRLAGGLQVTSVAEGVETPEQLAMLRSMRCDLAQGYLLSRPLAAGDVLERVRAGCAISRHATALADMPVSGASDRPAA